MFDVGLTSNRTDFIVNELHETLPGICRMKALARSYVWWPNMDKELENKVKHCGQCEVNRKAPLVAPLHHENATRTLGKTPLGLCRTIHGSHVPSYCLRCVAKTHRLKFYQSNCCFETTVSKIRLHGFVRIVLMYHPPNFESTAKIGFWITFVTVIDQSEA